MNRKTLIPVILVTAGLLCWSCGEVVPETKGVIVISIDTLRADRLGCYGYERPTSPFLDSFATTGTLFETATTQSPWTLPAHASMLTGRFPHHTGVVTEADRLPGDVPTLASILDAAGFVTGAIVNSHWLSENQGLARGFLSFRFHRETVKSSRGLLIVNKGKTITDEAIAWLDRHGKKPFFLFLHYYDVHSSYHPDADHRRLFVRPYEGKADGSTGQLMAVRQGTLRYSADDARHISDLYDAEIHQLDIQLGRLLAHLRELGIDGTTCVAITSDHGEEFMEHGRVLHGQTMFDEVLRIPLILGGPGVPTGRRVEEPVMAVDIVPTLLGRLGIDEADRFDGRDLLSSRGKQESSGETGPRLAFACADWRNSEPDVLRMVRGIRFKLIHNRITKNSELYDLSLDPAETEDISGDHPGLVEELMERLGEIMAGKREGERIRPRSSEQIEELKSLGYF